MEVIQGYENLIEEYSKIELYYEGMNYKKAIEKYKIYLMELALNESNNSVTLAARKLNITHGAIIEYLKSKGRYVRKSNKPRGRIKK